jgi:CPA2 family monovalent cation:H+ antiporter-2
MKDPLLSTTLMCLLILLMIFLLKKFCQPYLIAYITAGILLGPQVCRVYEDTAAISNIGEIGIILMMFFLGMEINIPDRKSLLIQPVIAQLIKIGLSFLLVLGLSRLFRWPVGDMLLLATLLIFNSTAVVSEYLKKNEELDTHYGQIVLNILLLQDILLGPTLTILQLRTDGGMIPYKIAGGVIGSGLLILLLMAIRNRNLIQLSILRSIQHDHELQVFCGGLICLGFAAMAQTIGLSAPVGSFAAGLFIGRAGAFSWLEHVFRPFKVFFVALFFVSVGLMFDIRYFTGHLWLIIASSVVVLVVNSGLSSVVFRTLSFSWRDSLYCGALLSQTGEFGIVALSLAHTYGIIGPEFFKAGIAITCLTLLLSTLWMSMLKGLIYRRQKSENPVQNPISN